METTSRDSQRNGMQRGCAQTHRPSRPLEVRRQLHDALLGIIDDPLAHEPETTPEQIFETLYTTAKVVARRNG
jgi:hypothetical protein